MADVNATVKSAASGIVGVIKALIVLFVFVNIVSCIIKRIYIEEFFHQWL